MLIKWLKRFVCWLILFFIVLVIGLFATAQWKSSQVIQPESTQVIQPESTQVIQPEVVQAIPVVLDFTKLPKPENGELAIEAERSILWKDKTHRIVFWKDNTLNIDGIIHEYKCTKGGTIYVKVNEWFVYYDCDKGLIAASPFPYPTVVKNFDANADVRHLVEKDTTYRTPNNWQIETNSDGSIATITTPLGEVFTANVRYLLRGDTDTLLDNMHDPYVFTIDRLRLMVTFGPKGLIVAESKVQ